jgi:hypothetical protein
MKRAFLFAVVTMALFAASPAPAADPDWDQINKSAVDLLQRYVRIESIDPRNDRDRAGRNSPHFSKKRHRGEIYEGSNGQTNLWRAVAGIAGCRCCLNHLMVPVDRKAKFDPLAAVIRRRNGAAAPWT